MVKKLSLNLIEELVFRFFVQGTVFKSDYGAAPLIQYNEFHYKNTQIEESAKINSIQEYLN